MESRVGMMSVDIKIVKGKRAYSLIGCWISKFYYQTFGSLSYRELFSRRSVSESTQCGQLFKRNDYSSVTIISFLFIACFGLSWLKFLFIFDCNIFPESCKSHPVSLLASQLEASCLARSIPRLQELVSQFIFHRKKEEE